MKISNKMRKKLKKKPIKFLIATMGPGETIQGIALANYALRKGADIVFAIRMEMNYIFFKNQKQKTKIYLIETLEKLKKIFKKEKPDVFVLCNSKIVSYYKDFLQNPPFPKPITVSIDSNWLFLKNEPWYSFVEWADKYLIVFPKKVFDSGLKKHGGNYSLPPQIMKKIEPVGFIPSFKKISFKERLKIRKKYKIGKNEKLIFSYFGGFGAGFRLWALNNLIKATESLIQRRLKIKIICVWPKENIKNLEKKSWLIRKESLSNEEFFSILSSSDLVFQHQGLGTLAQGISSQIPVIANVRNIEDEPHPKHAHAWEIAPFAKVNMCKMFYRSSPIEKIKKGMERLLYDKKEIKKMKDVQKKYYLPGEAKAYRIIMKLIDDKKYEKTKNRTNRSA